MDKGHIVQGEAPLMQHDLAQPLRLGIIAVVQHHLQPQRGLLAPVKELVLFLEIKDAVPDGDALAIQFLEQHMPERAGRPKTDAVGRLQRQQAGGQFRRQGDLAGTGGLKMDVHDPPGKG